MSKILLKMRASLDIMPCDVYEIKGSEKASCLHISVMRNVTYLEDLYA